MVDEQKALKAEIKALKRERTAWRVTAENAEKDAERYQKVRRGQHWSVINGIGDILRGDDLDAAIESLKEAP